MNPLSLIIPLLDNICQIRTKVLQCPFCKKKELNKALMSLFNFAKSLEPKYFGHVYFQTTK